MRHDRYRARIEANGTWTIADVFTDWPAGLPSERTQGLPKEHARTLVLFLNDLDRERRGIPLPTGPTCIRHTATRIMLDDDLTSASSSPQLND